MNKYDILKAFRVFHEKDINEGIHCELALMSSYACLVHSLIRVVGPITDWDSDTRSIMCDMLAECERGRHPFFTLGKLYRSEEAA